MLPQKAAAGMAFEHLQAIEQPEATTGMLRVRAYYLGREKSEKVMDK
jgi:hypothetical protein